MNSLFTPTASCNYPVRELIKIKLKFQFNWLQKWEWLASSRKMIGKFFKYFILLFNDYFGKGSHKNIGSLIVKPFIVINVLDYDYFFVLRQKNIIKIFVLISTV